MTTLKTLIITTLMLTLAVTAMAQPGQRGQGCMDGDRGRPMMAQLDLTEEQQTAVDALREKGRAGMIENRKDMARLDNQLEGLMLQDRPDAKKVEKMVRRIGDLKTDMRVQRMDTRLEIRELLTPDQRDRMMSMRAHKGRDGHGRGYAPGNCDQQFGKKGHGPRGGHPYGDCDDKGFQGRRR